MKFKLDYKEGLKMFGVLIALVIILGYLALPFLCPHWIATVVYYLFGVLVLIKKTYQ